MVRNYGKDLILHSLFVKKHLSLIFFLVFIFSINAYSSKLNTAFEALSIHDYFKAKKLFYTINKKKINSEACYGLSIIYYRQNNPFHNYDSACKYAALSFNTNTSSNTNTNISGFIISKLQIQIMIDSIASKKLKICQDQNTIESYDSFLKQNYLASQSILRQALFNRDELELQYINTINKSDSTFLFIQTHPQSELKNAAVKFLEKQLFDEITAEKTEASYINFINSQAKNSHINRAYQALLTIYKDKKDKIGISNFIKNYPNAPQRTEAWQALFTLSISTFKKDELQMFLTNYPDFPFKESILKEVQMNDMVLIPIKQNDLIGFADTSGKIVINPLYDEVTDFYEGLSIVQKNDSVYFINKENSNTLRMIFNDALPFYNGLAPVKQVNKWYLIDRLGELKSEGFEEINELNNEIYVVKQNNLYGAIDPYGKMVYEIKFDKLGDFKNNCAYYQLGSNYGFINKNGYIHKAEFEWISDFNENGLAIYKRQNKFGLIKQTGEFLTHPHYDQIIKATDKIYLMIQNDLYGYYSAEGCFLSGINFDYDKEKPASYYTNGFALKLIKKNDQALMDLNGRISIDFGVFSEINFAADGLIRIKKNNKYGYTDRKLNTVIPCKYLQATDFTDSTAIVVSKKGYHLLNTKGEEIFTSETSIKPITRGLFLIEKEDNVVLIDKHGTIKHAQFTTFETYKNWLIIYLQNNQIKFIRI